MRRVIVAWMIACLASTAGVLAIAAAPAHAGVGPVELAVSAARVTTTGGSQVRFHLHMFNNGPGDTSTGQVMFDYQAPTGTRLVGQSQLPTSLVYEFPPHCVWLSSGTHV